jgi:hypothetical protein
MMHTRGRVRPALARSLAVVLTGALAVACSSPEREQPDAGRPGSYLFVFAGDADQMTPGGGHDHGSATADSTGDQDFMVVIDADTASPTYAQVVSTVRTGLSRSMPHHVELDMPADGHPLVGSAYAAGRAFLFDFNDPMQPRIAGALDSVPGLHTPHSFVRLANGNVVATMQYSSTKTAGNPGGLALFSPAGRVLQSRSAADPRFPGASIRTYSLDVAPQTDRVLTTSTPMSDERTADVVQLWRLSDLSLLQTIPVPRAATDTMWHYPFEVRFLADGATAFMNTYYCALYALSGLDGDAPRMERVLALEYPRYNECGVPLLIGSWWIMPVTGAGEYVVIDIADPRAPRITSTLAAEPGFAPHWLSREPGSNRLVATSEGTIPGVRLMVFDSTSGRLAWDERFRETKDGPLGVRFDRPSWPHGSSGPALPHGAVFSRPKGRQGR